MSKRSYNEYGQHKWVLHGDTVHSAKIHSSTVNIRGLIDSYEVFSNKIEKLITVKRNRMFDDETKATKALFEMKLRGEKV